MRWRNMTLNYYHNTLGFLLVFSIIDRNSFENVKLFMGYIKNSGLRRSWTMLIGNKCDLKDQREVSYEEAKKIADEWDILYIEVSAKTGHNIGRPAKLLCEIIEKLDN
ncbi:unnamed protein product [Blepharisma stoltei]|uniref:Uncharacterized protein n=1 Tax=Blepharisma stoltei TaxID=1481888 RepID=A0AAU9JDG8_9CILI|nr:unnamed protein product [Blepharisma stoltei]